jgi:hypothetical protein
MGLNLNSLTDKLHSNPTNWLTAGVSVPFTASNTVNSMRSNMSTDQLIQADAFNRINGNADGTYAENAADTIFGPRYVASGMIDSMSNDFYNESDPYSGVSLKRDLEAMTTYNGNKGMLGQLNAASTAQNGANFDNATGQLNRTVSRYGGQQTAEAQAQQTGDMSRSRMLGSSDVKNRNNSYQNDLNKQLMSGLNVAPKAPGV